MNSQNSRNSPPKPGGPKAPSPYRPQPVPLVLQRKSVNQSVNTPPAPPVYRPQPAPLVLQRKTQPATQAPPKNPFPHRPASVPAMNNIAQRKANSYPGKQLVDRSRTMRGPRGIPSRGTVQRAQDPNAPAPEQPIHWSFLSHFPLSVEVVLKKMPDQIPEFKDLCQKVIKKKGGLFLKLRTCALCGFRISERSI